MIDFNILSCSYFGKYSNTLIYSNNHVKSVSCVAIFSGILIQNFAFILSINPLLLLKLDQISKSLLIIFHKILFISLLISVFNNLKIFDTILSGDEISSLLTKLAGKIIVFQVSFDLNGIKSNLFKSSADILSSNSYHKSLNVFIN
jgi:hypothetical protein